MVLDAPIAAQHMVIAEQRVLECGMCIMLPHLP